jgi:hypothetical protein
MKTELQNNMNIHKLVYESLKKDKNATEIKIYYKDEILIFKIKQNYEKTRRSR